MLTQAEVDLGKMGKNSCPSKQSVFRLFNTDRPSSAPSLYAQIAPVFERRRLPHVAPEQNSMSELSALERRRYSAVAAKFAAQYQEAEDRQQLTFEFRANLALSLENENGLKRSTLLDFIEFPDLLVFTETEFFPTEKAPNVFF